ncbi:MAG TPA: ATPase, T2SS/T4P/T4SS family [Actinomycetota bacterium]|nr:ATPase, T2SS/T4P/T4SS family [Actinomycetota bacterium]
MEQSILQKVFRHADDIADLDEGARRLALRRLAAEEPEPVSIDELVDEVDGFGPLAPLMRDDRVSDIFVNGPDDVWFERDGTTQAASLRFQNADAVLRFADRWLGRAGERVDAARPIADARLPDGSRLNVVLPPVSQDGPLMSIRKWPGEMPSLYDLLELGTMTPSQYAFLCEAVSTRSSLAISGATGSGKTTLLNALIGVVPFNERVVILEETPELRPPLGHSVRLATRPAGVEGTGEIDLAALVRTALRMRPDRLIVGEVRGPEALGALTALATGHEGSMVTLHARSARETIERFVTLALQAPGAPEWTALTRQFSAAFSAVVHVARVDGHRRVVEIDPLVSLAL